MKLIGAGSAQGVCGTCGSRCGCQYQRAGGQKQWVFFFFPRLFTFIMCRNADICSVLILARLTGCACDHEDEQRKLASCRRAFVICQAHSVFAGHGLRYSRSRVAVSMAASSYTIAHSFIDNLNYLHNYILSSLLQFVSCWIISSRRA